jgi:SAM-dependent methyltransferase
MAAERMRSRGELPEAGCPLCGGPGEDWRQKAGYRVLRCGTCRNAFLPEDQIPPDLETLYSREYFEGDQAAGYPHYLEDAPLLAKNFDRRLRWLARFCEPGRLLDVGTAYGFFLERARVAGWEAMGVEIAPDCADEARRIAGVPVVAGDFVKAALPGKFDVVTLLDVLEHVRDPVASLEKARSLLEPDGWVVIETGDIDTAWARLLRGRWYFLDPPNHLHYFTATGLDALLRRCGFAGEIRRQRLGRWVSLSNVAFKLAYGLPPGLLRETALSAARSHIPGSLYLNFGDGQLVAARAGAESA